MASEKFRLENFNLRNLVLSWTCATFLRVLFLYPRKLHGCLVFGRRNQLDFLSFFSLVIRIDFDLFRLFPNLKVAAMFVDVASLYGVWLTAES